MYSYFQFRVRKMYQNSGSYFKESLERAVANNSPVTHGSMPHDVDADADGTFLSLKSLESHILNANFALNSY